MGRDDVGRASQPPSRSGHTEHGLTGVSGGGEHTRCRPPWLNHTPGARAGGKNPTTNEPAPRHADALTRRRPDTQLLGRAGIMAFSCILGGCRQNEGEQPSGTGELPIMASGMPAFTLISALSRRYVPAWLPVRRLARCVCGCRQMAAPNRDPGYHTSALPHHSPSAGPPHGETPKAAARTNRGGGASITNLAPFPSSTRSQRPPARRQV